jgi:hypothetical protein
MRVIDAAGAFRFGARVDPEDDADGFASIGIFVGRIEQPPIGPMMALIIIGDMGRVGGAILESGYRHRLVPLSAIAPCAC